MVVVTICYQHIQRRTDSSHKDIASTTLLSRNQHATDGVELYALPLPSYHHPSRRTQPLGKLALGIHVSLRDTCSTLISLFL